MPGMRCCVAICNNSRIKTLDRGVSYYSFPSNPKIREEWIRCTSRKPPWNPDSCHICSDHFTADDYVRDLKSELLGLSTKPKLKPDAVPSLKLLVSPLRKTKKDTEKEQESDSRRKIIAELLEEDGSSPKSEEVVNAVPSLKFLVSNSPIKPRTAKRKERRLKICQEFESGQIKAFLLEDIGPSIQAEEDSQLPLVQTLLECHNCSRLRAELNQKENLINILKRKVDELEKKAKNESEITQQKVESAFNHVFSPEQLALITNKQKSVHWKEKDMQQAFNLRCISLKAYKYVRDVLNYPFPGPSSLRRWAASKDKKSLVFCPVDTGITIEVGTSGSDED